MAKTAKSKKFKVGVSGMRPMRVPITNIHGKNNYSARVLIGSQKVPVNVLLDTGSSTFAVSPTAYNPDEDTLIEPTTMAQSVEYGTGGWAGPVVNTTITIGDDELSVSLKRSNLAVTHIQEEDNFVGVKGILGLAFGRLNLAYDLKNILAEKDAEFTHPWPFRHKDFGSFQEKLNELRAENDIPEKYIDPYFNELSEVGIVANKFAFYTLRSRSHHFSGDDYTFGEDPLNKGFFILGGGEEQEDLYEGDMDSFLTAKVFHHRYYNTKLLAVQVEGCEEAKVRPLQQKYVKESISNSIIDSGTNILCMAKDVYRYIKKSLEKINPEFIELIKESDVFDTGLDLRKLNLDEWPLIHFTFAGLKRSEIRLTCTPDTYWQIRTPTEDRAVFQIQGPTDHENQSIFGLPLLNNYYTVFDRSVNETGVVRFAPIKKLRKSK